MEAQDVEVNQTYILLVHICICMQMFWIYLMFEYMNQLGLLLSMKELLG